MTSYQCCNIDESTLLRSSRYSLQDAAERGDVGALQEILEPQIDLINNPQAALALPFIDINARDNIGCTALHTAVLFRRLEAVRFLVSKGAKLSGKCNGSPLAHVLLSMASVTGNHGFALLVVNDLLAAGLDVSASDDLGRYVLHIAALHGLREFAEVLWAHGPAREKLDLAAVDRTGASALHTACEYRHAGMLSWLLSVGASPHAVDKVGDTPAHTAGKAGWREGMALLYQHGADKEVKNGAGLTVEDVFTAHTLPCGPSPAPPLSLIMTHQDCMHHHTVRPPITRETAYVPPENTVRLDVLLNPVYGTLRAKELGGTPERARIVYTAPPCKLSDVLRVHDYEYVRRVLHASGSAGLGPQVVQQGAAAAAAGSRTIVDPSGIHLLDADTAVSRGTWPAALRAAGAVCAAIDAVVSGSCRTAFCAVRPPGHHAGPTGIVPSESDPEGSHGFCLLNNVAIGAAYAMAQYGRERGAYGVTAGVQRAGAQEGGQQQQVRKIAIFDFDVHHGNGTEAILRNLTPHEEMTTVTLPFARAAIGHMAYKPWLDEGDGGRVMFISSHGYGSKWDGDGRPVPSSIFYPGSGASTGWDVTAAERLQGEATGTGGAATAMQIEPVTPGPGVAASQDESASGGVSAAKSTFASPRAAASSAFGPATATASSVSSEAQPLPAPYPSLQPVPVPEPMYESGVSAPHIINVAMPHAQGPKAWRRAMVGDVLPRLAAFAPDLILVSAGFDAHKADDINSGYIRFTEEDYAWITRQLVKVANGSAHGRVVSVLEGGYKVQGKIVSPFARSVAAHVRALSSGISEAWDSSKERTLLLREMQYEAEQVAKAEAERVARAEQAAAAGISPHGTTFKSPRASMGKGGSSFSSAAFPTSSAPSGERGSHGHSESAQHSSSTQAGVAHLSAGPTPISTAAAPSAESASSPVDVSGTGRSKRRRVQVDYAALDAQLKAEQAAAAAKAQGGAEGSGAGATPA